MKNKNMQRDTHRGNTYHLYTDVYLHQPGDNSIPVSHFALSEISKIMMLYMFTLDEAECVAEALVSDGIITSYAILGKGSPMTIIEQDIQE